MTGPQGTKNHKDATTIHLFAYVTPSDPGAVGAKKGWVDTGTGPPYQLKVRNLSNTGWDVVGSTSAGHVIQVNGVALPPRSILNFVGANVYGIDDEANDTTIVSFGAGGLTLGGELITLGGSPITLGG